MKYQGLFSGENKKKYFRICAVFFPSMLKIKGYAITC